MKKNKLYDRIKHNKKQQQLKIYKNSGQIRDYCQFFNKLNHKREKIKFEMKTY